MKNILLILFGVSLNALAQLFTRQGMLQIGKVSLILNEPHTLRKLSGIAVICPGDIVLTCSKDFSS